jgi:hypothetical protein
MALTIDQPTASVSSHQSESFEKTYHENLITDLLLTRALQAILDGTSADGRMRASQMREKAGFTLGEAVQLLRYLHRQGVLQEEVDGRRVVNRSLALDYLSIAAPVEETPPKEESKEKQPFSQAQIAWGCMHAFTDKLTPMRVARPSRWTIDLARALGLVSSDTAGVLLFSTSRAKRLCGLITDMSEEVRASYVSWAESQLPGEERAAAGESVG